MRKSRSNTDSVYGNLLVGNRRPFPWPFDPIQERSMTLRLRAGDETYTDDGTTLVSSDGDVVQMWRNMLNTAERFRQATAGSKPTYKVNILNGHAVLRFDGGDFLDHNNSDHFFGSWENTIICVCSVNTGAADYIFSGSGGEGGPAFISKFNPGSGVKDFEYFMNSVLPERQTFAATASGFHILTVTRPEGAFQHRLFYDGLLVATGTNDNSGTGNWISKYLARIGRFASGGSGGVTLDIAEIRHFTSVLPAHKLNDQHLDLSRYYDLPVSLA